jgi:hypothetical protein
VSLLQDYYVANTGEIVINPYAVTQQVNPSPRRPDAGEQPRVERKSFAVLSDSGELPIAFIETPRPRPEETARIVTGSTWPGPVPADPDRPRWYRGVHRVTRSRAALAAAATAQAGARGRRDGA